MYAKINELPEAIQSVLAGLNYNRKDIQVEARERVSPFASSGDGYRAFCAIIDLTSGQVDIKQGSWGGGNMFSLQNQVDLDTREYLIPPNVVVVKGHEGGGKPVYATIVMRPDMIVPWLPAKEGLSPRLQWIVDCVCALTSAGRKAEFNGYEMNGGRRIPPQEHEWQALEGLGYIKRNKTGSVSITTEGRNARTSGLGIAKYAAP